MKGIHPSKLMPISRGRPWKKNTTPGVKKKSFSPLTRGKNKTLDKNSSTEPGWGGGREVAAPPLQMHSQHMLRDSLAVHRTFWGRRFRKLLVSCVHKFLLLLLQLFLLLPAYFSEGCNSFPGHVNFCREHIFCSRVIPFLKPFRPG